MTKGVSEPGVHVGDVETVGVKPAPTQSRSSTLSASGGRLNTVSSSRQPHTPPALLWWARAGAGHADRHRRVRLSRYDSLQVKGVGPVIPKVVGVEGLVPGVDEQLIQSDRGLVDALEVVVDGVLRTVLLGEIVGGAVTAGEIVQVRIGPPHRGLQDVENTFQRQLARRFQMSPDRRLGIVQIDPDPISDQVVPRCAAPGRIRRCS